MADGYGSQKIALLSFPLAQAFISALYIISIYTNQQPRYWRKKLKRNVNEDELKQLISEANHIIDWVLILTMIMFLYIQCETFLVGAGRQKQLKPEFIFVVIGLQIASVVYMLINQIRRQSQATKTKADDKISYTHHKPD